MAHDETTGLWETLVTSIRRAVEHAPAKSIDERLYGPSLSAREASAAEIILAEDLDKLASKGTC